MGSRVVAGPKIYYIELHDLGRSSFSELLGQAESINHRTMPSFGRFEDQAAYLAGHALRAYARSRQDGVPIYESLTHTHGLAALGVSERGAIGVDGERIVDGDNMEATARYFMSEGEFREFLLCPAPERARMLTRYWTLKEALSKAVGLGAGVDFSRLGFALDPVRLIFAPVRLGMADRWSFFQKEISGTHILSCAVQAGDGEPEWVGLSLDDLRVTRCAQA